MKVLHVDTNHPVLIEGLAKLGYENHEDYTATKAEIEQKIDQYEGLVIRSRFSIDADFLAKAKHLKFIGRVGAGLENIDLDSAAEYGVYIIGAPEGNRQAVAEHCLGMLLSLFNKFLVSHQQVLQGKWLREENRGLELTGKTVGLYGYGYMGKCFAKVLRGFDLNVICYDIKEGVGDKNAQQVDLVTFYERCDVVSLHLPQTPLTVGVADLEFFNHFKKPIWILNTARGSCVVTKDLVAAMKSGKVLGAGLDVLEYEKKSFENWEATDHEVMEYLRSAPNVLLTPHVAGWTVESKIKLAQTIVDKVKAKFFNHLAVYTKMVLTNERCSGLHRTTFGGQTKSHPRITSGYIDQSSR